MQRQPEDRLLEAVRDRIAEDPRTPNALSEDAGLPRNTVSKMLAGAGVSARSLARILHAMGLLDPVLNAIRARRRDP